MTQTPSADGAPIEVPVVRRPKTPSEPAPTAPAPAAPSPHAAVIEQAKGLVMGAYAVSPDTAFEMIRKWSRDGNLKVRDVCATLVATAQPDEADQGSGDGVGADGPVTPRARATLDEALAALVRTSGRGRTDRPSSR